MAEEKMELALQVYDTLCAALDHRGWNYEKDEEKLLVHFGVNGDDLPMKFIIFVDEERQVIRLMSPLPFEMSEHKRIDGVLATCAASYGMLCGGFDYDVSDGKIVFRMTNIFTKSQVDEELFAFMIDCSCAMVDKYNDQFLAIDKGMLSVEDFLQKETQ